MTTFKTEAQFEQAFIEVLSHKGWEAEILKNKTEADLLQNWANILFENNRQQDRLNDVPLTSGEMQQIIEQIKELKTPLKLNGLINGKTVAIKRDNPAHPERLGKEVSLKIYDRQEIAAGQSRYQIVQQPKFERGSPLRNDRRGDVLLLINGMPVIHVELKRSGVPVSQAVNQIEKYSAEGIFSGLFSLIQVFVAMEPNETKYFANPGLDGKFNPDYQFNWANFNNEPKNYWKDIASDLLSIPMAHQLIGFYTVADDTDGVLKVMRSYQYYAANAISDKVAKTHWKQINSNTERLGGYIWHTTGSGKTMTSFKSAQLISQSKDADKVIFLMDRIELGTQSLAEYRSFAGDGEDVQATENTDVLISKLKSTDPAETLIVSSIQKMSNVFEAVDDEGTATNSADIEIIQAKRLVFIIDEAHRSTFGDMLITIKRTFPSALFFGFTGTPIQEENEKSGNTTSTVFGNELHRYSIADGIRDGNVLGFDPYKVPTFKDSDIKKEVALAQAKADSVADAMSSPAKKKKFNHFMNDVPMAGKKDAMGKYHKGIEDYVPKSQYLTDAHQEEVVSDILDKWDVLSQGNKFHAILATNSIAEAIDYYHRLKAAKPELKISALFDPNIDNDGSGDRGPTFKGDGLDEIMADYNARYGQDFDFAKHGKFKKDLAARLAHKRPYERIHTEPEKQLDLLIVVDQMLTGFDSKWLNTLYLDKVIKYQNIIQAFSRTNRLFGPDKPHGIIRYYRYPHTMEQHINDAVKLYSGDRPIGLFVDRLESNLEAMNTIAADITELFASAGVENFEKLPEDLEACAKFANLFKTFNQHLEAAKVQGFQWREFSVGIAEQSAKYSVDSVVSDEAELTIDEQTYLSLVLRYKELARSGDGGGAGGGEVPFDISGYLTEIDTGKIDTDYMNSRFDKYLKELNQGQDKASVELTLNELHKSFSSLTQNEQKYAKLFLHDLQRGDAKLVDGHSFRDYINDYQNNVENAKINALVDALGVDKSLLIELMGSVINEKNINQFGRFDNLKATVDIDKAKAYFESEEGRTIPPFKLRIKVDKHLQGFILED
ncbi:MULTISPECIES: HsdR family type I site-specific deoxyribonuclease [Pseudoalteromonas]|uniref:type I restriction endonuclease subunit R, EcoR124 family n=1 Tax=Pseudoalteromonas TaxID=53246 RepID=UPI000C44C977|nr:MULTISPECIES: HsdR family type I site-specific deoxyribonuclease [Pseudoalteromonas]MAY57696.1 DEAD/DEAH box helicase [Pseudoalteromonas sp.]MDN3409109.1 HsdR family type I site-specific deoxyribonuclease [Pseudoalteromonas sp. APC 3894]MDN3416495.1 HsdR family type I site-specific deoxyribonuclease [Pseudoalteromonas sp. APC 3227]MDN3420192.1 HsdR family type I site-specific deoxyribonuclease [Pseudoalteromonas sp. APC 3895]MDN3423785.1 HsdR family type I site-specific deoxyribonuclease [P|tara:strand:+ start:3058 stop:6237 length:3180 start_codon:yes stop_codon:yes gene_type:complete